MAKKKVSERKHKNKPLMPMEIIPMCYKQRRSLPPKRRTDFSLFSCCNSSYSSNSGSLLESSSLFNKSLNSIGDSVAKHLFSSSLVRYNHKISDEGSGLSSISSDASILEVGLANQKIQLESLSDRKIDKLTSEDLGVLDCNPKKSHDSMNLCLSPESVTTDKTCEICLPTTDLSQVSSGELFKNNDATLYYSDEQDLSSDKSTFSISSRIDDDSVVRGRGKRERKPKVHFDDINISMQLKPDSQVRRLRIMRYLGLMPPIGSPFGVGHVGFLPGRADNNGV